MSGREPESAEFAPERLSKGSGRRIDPLAIGALVVIGGLVLAIAKPWGSTPAEQAGGAVAASPSVEAAAEPSVPSASVAPTTPSGARPGPATVAPLARGRLATVLAIRHEWGVRAVVNDKRESDGDIVEDWRPIDPRAIPEEPVLLGDIAGGVLAIGVTFPPDDAPLDIRAWRPTSDGGWEWLDTTPMGRTLNSGLLLPPPRVHDVTTTTWPPGRVRLDVLTAAGIAQVEVAIPDLLDQVPGPTPATPRDRSMRSPLDPDLSDVPVGRPFAVEDGQGIALAGGSTGATSSPFLAWLESADSADTADTGATSVDASRTNGLGVTFPVGATGVSATLSRLEPEPVPVVDAKRSPGLHFGPEGRVPFIVFRAPGSTTWAPGTYRLDVRWTLGGVPASATYHAVLRPSASTAPGDLLVATRLFAPVAGTTEAVGATAALDAREDLACTGEPGVGIVDGLSPSVIGIGHPLDVTPSTVQAEMLLDGGRVASVPLVAVRGAVPGLTVIAPADGYPFNTGVHRVLLRDGDTTATRIVCIGVGGPP